MESSANQASLSAKESARRCQLSEGAQALMEDKLAPAAFVEALSAQQLYLDALEFAAQALPTQAVVWWGCVCVWRCLRSKPDPDDVEALRAAVRWVHEPTEANRRHAEAAGKQNAQATPASLLAQAAFYSDGSIAPADQPKIAAPAGFAGRLVTCAMHMALSRAPTEKSLELYRQFVRMSLPMLGRLEKQHTARGAAAAESGSVASQWEDVKPAAPTRKPAFDPNESVVGESVVAPSPKKASPAPPRKKRASSSRPDAEKDMLDTGMSDFPE
jgi:hypothetical protein